MGHGQSWQDPLSGFMKVPWGHWEGWRALHLPFQGLPPKKHSIISNYLKLGFDLYFSDILGQIDGYEN